MSVYKEIEGLRACQRSDVARKELLEVGENHTNEDSKEWQELIATISSLNNDGISMILLLMGGIERIEKYNKSTSPERLEEIKVEEAEKEIRDAEERKTKMFANMKRSIEEREQKIEALTGKEKQFYEKIEKVRAMNIGRYYGSGRQMLLIAELYNNNYMNAAYDEFCYGFYQGMQYLKNKRREK